MFRKLQIDSLILNQLLANRTRFVKTGQIEQKLGALWPISEQIYDHFFGSGGKIEID